MRKQPLCATYLLAASLSISGCADELKSIKPMIDKIECYLTKASLSLEERLKKVASEKSNIYSENYSLECQKFSTDEFPFKNYRSGLYIVASSKDKNHRVFYSRRGDYIGYVYKSKMEEDTWIAESTDDNGNIIREKYRLGRLKLPKRE